MVKMGDYGVVADITLAYGGAGKYEELSCEDSDGLIRGYLEGNPNSISSRLASMNFNIKIPSFIAKSLISRGADIQEQLHGNDNLPAEWLIPEVIGDMKHPKTSRGLSPSAGVDFKSELEDLCANGYRRYQSFIVSGVDPDIARIFLHSNHYINYNWKGDINGVMRILENICLDRKTNKEEYHIARCVVKELSFEYPLTSAFYFRKLVM